ncbi:MAG: hypothetical protein M1281_16835 [Chloroflexi bacterium]|nr:hypothetical protein [Chloroflexota bacterium]
MSDYSNLIIGLLVLAFLLYRQLQIRPVRKRVSFTLPLILVILGVVSLESYLSANPPSLTTIISIIFSLLFLAIGMGAIRAATVRLWTRDGILFRQGTLLTIVLWIVSVAMHLAADYFGHAGESSLLLYYAITLFVQSVIVQSRAKGKFPHVEPQY